MSGDWIGAIIVFTLIGIIVFTIAWAVVNSDTALTQYCVDVEGQLVRAGETLVCVMVQQ